MDAQKLIEELVAGLSEGGFVSEAELLSRHLDRLLNGTESEKSAAADFIIGRCHIKAYGDLNIPIRGESRNQLLSLLSAIRSEVTLLSNNSLQARLP